MENATHVHLEESGEFFPHEIPRLPAVVAGIGHEHFPQIFHFVHGTFALVLLALEVASLIDVGIRQEPVTHLECLLRLRSLNQG